VGGKIMAVSDVPVKITTITGKRKMSNIFTTKLISMRREVKSPERKQTKLNKTTETQLKSSKNSQNAMPNRIPN
jgi:hypothetical protein